MDKARGKYQRATVNGRNSIIHAIADLKEDIAFNIYETASVHSRLDLIEPTLKTLEQERQRRIGVVKFISGGRLWFVAFGGALILAVQHFFGISPPPIPPHGP
jgi:hypothetical protein